MIRRRIGRIRRLTELHGLNRRFVLFRVVRDLWRRLRARTDLVELAMKKAGHPWLECDLAAASAEWMAGIEYRDSCFESPEDLELRLEEDFAEHMAGRVPGVLQTKYS